MNIQNENQQVVVIPKSLYKWTIIFIISIIGVIWSIVQLRIIQDNPPIDLKKVADRYAMHIEELDKKGWEKYGKFMVHDFYPHAREKLDKGNYASHQEREQAVCDEAIKLNREFGQYYCWKMKQIPNPEAFHQPPVFESTTEMLENPFKRKGLEDINA